MAEFTRTRDEVRQMLDRWLETNREAEASGDWAGLADYYAPDATYRYTIGAFGSREAIGRDAVRALVMERDMIGFQGWTFPYEWIVIDGEKVMTKWYMQPPFERPDGTPYRVLGMSSIKLNDDLEIVEMEDSMDIAALLALMEEMKAAGHEVLVPTAPDLT